MTKAEQTAREIARKLVSCWYISGDINIYEEEDFVEDVTAALVEASQGIQELEAENKKMREALQDVEGLSLVLIKELEKLK
jgi:polyhydroxyalkanoate synthesis regulator phasin